MEKTALFLSPHFDDEVLMGGGTIQVLKRKGWKVVVIAFTQSEESGATSSETMGSMEKAKEILGIDTIGVDKSSKNLRDMHLADSPGDLIKAIIKQIRYHEPKVVFTTCKDFHVDHRAMAEYVPEAAYQASRKGIMGSGKSYYEPFVLLGRVDMEFPVKMRSDMFVELSKEEIEKKVEAIGAFGYLKDAHPATLDIFSESHAMNWTTAVAKLSGIECGRSDKYAEIFEIGNIKPMLDLELFL